MNPEESSGSPLCALGEVTEKDSIFSKYYLLSSNRLPKKWDDFQNFTQKVRSAPCCSTGDTPNFFGVLAEKSVSLPNRGFSRIPVWFRTITLTQIMDKGVDHTISIASTWQLFMP